MKLFLIAGEASGDALGAGLMRGLQTLAPGTRFEGVGGPLMQAEGLQSLFPMEELSVMGLMEVLPRYLALRRRLKQAVQAVLASAPSALITIDSPDFCLRVARAVRHQRPGLRVVHYVAPSVWAWRPGRAQRMAGSVDHVLALLPFEPPYMQAAGMTCDFVGHPVVARPRPAPDAVAAFRAAQGIATDAPVLLALPGSRRSEVARLGPRFGAALAPVLAAHPQARVLVPTVTGVAEQVRTMARNWPGTPLVLEKGQVPPVTTAAAFAAARAALAASGTVSLDLAAAGVPMVIGYDMSPISRAILQRMLRVDTVTLVNLVSESRAVPEFLGPACRPEALAGALLRLIADGPDRAAQQAAMALTLDRLGAGGPDPGMRAATSVLQFLDR